ncbi:MULTISPECIES: hypothetical protein [unclassified Streptomyces]|uniref:hypothetical protein n=1 Tax=unclassified Streptomyces TaxID=2593676 RepID=UPI0007002A41|nr:MULTISPECIES: hypothetical protein [unclassified Streptomyces]KQX52769.1 hypothetical protein ASD33_05750 [Streptomyces sp. Root1304]KRA89684.1 hypothetical protein ASE09_05755 [Streptomyces sp. Root66D1]
MASAPLRPRGARALTAAAALAATATAHLAVASPASATPVAATPAPTPAPAVPAPAIPAPDPPAPTCGTPATSGFPLDTKIHGGPVDYPAGGAPQEWRLDLTNTTDASCSGIHPVLVLTDRDRVLKPEQIRFEFYDEGSARWHPVAFEATEEAENVGAFAGFGGFAVPAGRTLTVPVRLAFRAETAPDEVVVNAAIVQRRGADGDWVGESGDYRLTVGPADPADSGDPTAPREPVPDTSAAPRPPGATPRPPAATAPGDRGRAEADGRTDPEADADRPELARTGGESEERTRLLVRRLAPLAAALVLLGAVLVRTGRRARHR